MIIYLLQMTTDEQFSTNIQSLFIGANIALLVICHFVMNINFITHSLFSILYLPEIVVMLKHFRDFDDELLEMLWFQGIPIIIGMVVYLYIQEREARLSFL